MKRTTIAACAAACALSGPAANAMPFAFEGGAAITDRFGYAGEIKRYSSLDDARNGDNSIDSISVSDRDLSLWVTQNDRDLADGNYALGSWWYTIDPDGRAGWGNTNGNTGVGFMQLFDSDASTDTSVDMAFSNFDGTYWTEFGLSVSGENAGAADSSRLSVYDNVNDGGIWHSYELSLSAGGLQGELTEPNVIEALNHPTSVDGRFTGVFQITENETSPDNQGFYSVDFDLNMDNWAFSNNGDLTGPYQSDGNIFPSEFRVVGNQVPEPGVIALLAASIAPLSLFARRGKRAHR